MEALAEIPLIAYKEISNDIQTIGDLTCNLMTIQRFDSLKQAMVFWTNVCQQELAFKEQGMNP